MCAFAGLRLAEAAGLQVGDVDFLRRQVTVARQLQRDGRRFEVRPPKYGGERTVYLADELVAMLAEHVRQHRPGDDPARWVFVDKFGKPLHHNALGHSSATTTLSTYAHMWPTAEDRTRSAASRLAAAALADSVRTAAAD